MPLSELMGRDRVLYEAALAAGHSVVQVEQCTLRYELVQPDRGNRQYDYQYAPSDLGYVRIARSTMNASTLVDERSPVYEESSIHYPEYARAGRQPTVYEWLNCIQYYRGEQARKFEVPDLLKPFVGADTITPKEAEHIRYQIDFTDYSDRQIGSTPPTRCTGRFATSGGLVRKAFFNVSLLPPKSSLTMTRAILGYCGATKRIGSTIRTGEQFYSSRSGLMTPKRPRIPPALSPTICEDAHCDADGIPEVARRVR